MDWIEDMVSDMLAAVPSWTPADYPILRLAALARAVDSKLFKNERAKQLKGALRVGLNQYIATGSVPSFSRKQTDKILRHHRLLGDLTLLVALPLEKESRVVVARAISAEG